MALTLPPLLRPRLVCDSVAVAAKSMVLNSSILKVKSPYWSGLLQTADRDAPRTLTTLFPRLQFCRASRATLLP